MKIRRSEILIPVLSVIAVIGLWYLSYIIIISYFSGPDTSEPWAKRGQIGDMFGAVNALFSGLAFAGIIYTIYLQRQELREQRRELRLTRKEFKQQNETLWLQRFENTFFNLLTSHQRLLETLNVEESITDRVREIYKGREVFDFLTRRISAVLKVFTFTENQIDAEVERVRPAFSKALIEYFDITNLYLESLHAVLHFTAHSDLIIDRERLQYFQFIKAQLSYNERTFIFYYLSLADPEKSGNMLFSLHQIERSFDFISFSESYLYDPSHMNLTKYWAKFK